MNPLEHEEVLARRGPRSGLTVIVAVPSTALEQAVAAPAGHQLARRRDAAGARST
jgi:hypothetical protein